MSLLVTALAAFVTNLAAMQAASDTDPAARPQAVIALLAAKDFAKVEAESTDRMKAALPADRLAAVWTKVTVTTREFEHAKMDVQIAFDAAGKLAGLFFRPADASVSYTPPTYVTPSSYTEEALTFGTQWKLPASLDIPNGTGPFPAVVLVHGSGPNDRDQTVGGNSPIEDAIVEQTRYLALSDGTITADEQAKIDEMTKIAAQIHALQGERDHQVTLDEFARWKAALAGKPNVTFHSYPELNHLFIAGHGKSLPAECETPGHIAEDVIRDIADWITRNAA